jgi:hypothetical protein
MKTNGGNTVDGTDKMAMFAFGMIALAAGVIAYRAYTQPSLNDVMADIAENFGVSDVTPAESVTVPGAEKADLN